MKEVDPQLFSVVLAQELIRNLPNWYGSDNWDSEVLPHKESFKDKIFTKIRLLNQQLFKDSILVKRTDFEALVQSYSMQGKSIFELAVFYRLLQDDYSKSLLVSLIAYRMMGYRKVKLPLNTASYWELRKSAHSLVKSEDTIKIKFRDWELNHINLEKVGYPIELFIMPVWVVALFTLKQYEYHQGTVEVKAQPGDYVIDAGGGWGDTALYFSHVVGEQGQVYTFEFADDNLEVIQRNLDLNPKLSNRIQIIQRALWDKSNEGFDYSVNGPATALNSNKNSQESFLQISTISIDDFVKERELPKVDFIKMDIEGAELKALMGAEKTIRSFKPKLAISVYHNQEDLVTISDYLNNLNIGYEFYLDHFTIYRGETILFAQTRTS